MGRSTILPSSARSSDTLSPSASCAFLAIALGILTAKLFPHFATSVSFVIKIRLTLCRVVRLGLQFLQDIGVQTLALPSCFRHDLAVHFGRHANQKLPGKRLLRVFPPGCAELQVVVHRVFEGLLQFPDGSSLKG